MAFIFTNGDTHGTGDGGKGGGILFLIHVLFMPFALQRETPKEKKKNSRSFHWPFLADSCKKEGMNEMPD